MSSDSDKALRDRIGKKLDEYMTDRQINSLFDDVLAMKKRGWAEFNCKKCGQFQKVQAEIPDTAAVTKALLDLANQSFGTPPKAADPPPPVPEVFEVADLSVLSDDDLRRIAG